jgi:hypothetical protein
MKLEEFSSICHKFWDGYFQWVQEGIYRGRVVSHGGTLLFPKLLLCTQTRNHLIVELVGADTHYHGLILKEHRQQNIEEYLSQFPDEGHEGAAFHFNTEGNRIEGGCISHEINFDEAISRFPALQLRQTRITRTGSNECLFSFGPQFRNTSIANCVLLHTNGTFLRSKHIIEMLIVAKNYSAHDLESTLHKLVNNSSFNGPTIKGVTTCAPGFEHDYLLVAQLQNLILTPHLRETTIGEFINQHPNLIYQAFQTEHFEYEPYLEWIETEEGNLDKAINPDLLFKSPRGTYDVLDLKTALLDKHKITRGERNRRRFIDAVNEGIAQLTNYAEYFKFEKNRNHAFEKYGISVHEPHLYLIVGYYDNSSRKEVEEALRPYNNITVLDYDSMIQMFLARAATANIS